MFLEKKRMCARDGETRREGTAVLAGARAKGRLMFGILISLRATDPARTSRRGLGVKTKAPPELQRPCLRGYSSALCTGRPLARDWQSDSRGDLVHWPFRGLKVCVTERSGFRREGLSVPTPPARPLWDLWSLPSPLKDGLKNFLLKQNGKSLSCSRPELRVLLAENHLRSE